MEKKINDLYEAKKFALNKVYEGLEAQGWQQSMGDVPDLSSGLLERSCAYRGEEGRKCAAGHLMRDDAPELKGCEGRAIRRVLLDVPGVLLEPLVDIATDYEFRNYVERMQRAHDRSETPEEMKKAFDYLKLELQEDA